MRMLFILLYLSFSLSAFCHQDPTAWTAEEQAEFEQLYERYVKGTASSADSARLEDLADRLQRLGHRQNEALKAVYEAGQVSEAPAIVGEQLQEGAEGVYFVMLSPDKTRWLALWGGVDGGEGWGPKTMAAFGFKHQSFWKVAVDYVTILSGHTLEEARLSYFRTLMKDLGFFRGRSAEPNPNFWESEGIEYMRQKAMEQ